MLLKKCLEMKMARTIRAFLEGARLCQTRARDEATIVLVGTKNWDLWAKLEGERAREHYSQCLLVLRIFVNRY